MIQQSITLNLFENLEFKGGEIDDINENSTKSWIKSDEDTEFDLQTEGKDENDVSKGNEQPHAKTNCKFKGIRPYSVE